MDSEKKYTPEEINAIVDEELRKANLSSQKELNLDEMENISGGSDDFFKGTEYRVPATHEEIDAKWDVIDAVYKAYGRDVAWITAAKLNCVASYAYILDEYGTGVLRDYMHRALDGKLTGLDYYSAH